MENGIEQQPNKLEGVRRALEALGYQAKPLVIQEYVKEHFGIEMNTDHISANKSAIIKKHGKIGPSEAPTPKTVRKKNASPSRKAGSKAKQNSGAVSLEDLQMVKELIERIGAEELKSLINIW